LQEGLGNVRPGPNNTPIHGLLVYSNLWKVTRAEATAEGATLVSRIEFWRYPHLMAQFPFAHNIEMIYRLKSGALEVETAIENLGLEPMPVSLGYHPYFQVNDAPQEEWTVRLPAREKHVLSNRLIPTGEKLPNPYASPLKLTGVALDDVFDSLDRDADGFSRFSVQGKRERVTVEYGPKFTVAVVYSPKGRGFICFEPMSGITNAFNAAHDGWYQGLQTVQAGATWRETFRIVTEGY
jgi:aldose 1-epimerase